MRRDGAIALGVAVLGWVTMAGAIELIKEEEAARPDDTTPPFVQRAPSRRPVIQVVAPAPQAGLVKSPLDLKVRFKAFGGSRINPDTIVITYMKSPAVDLTQRVRAFIRLDGVDLSEAEVPPGNHRIKIELEDQDGRPGVIEFTIREAK